MVRKERLELSRVAPQEPKSSASTNSATFAFGIRPPEGTDPDQPAIIHIGLEIIYDRGSGAGRVRVQMTREKFFCWATGGRYLSNAMHMLRMSSLPLGRTRIRASSTSSRPSSAISVRRDSSSAK